MTLYRRPLRDGLEFGDGVGPDWPRGRLRTVKANDDGTFDILDSIGARVRSSLTEQQFYDIYAAVNGWRWHWITPPDEPEPAPAELTEEERRAVKAAAIRNVLDRTTAPERPEFQAGDRFKRYEGAVPFTLVRAAWEVQYDDAMGRLVWLEDQLREAIRLPAKPEPPTIDVAEDATVARDQHGRRWVLEVGES